MATSTKAEKKAQARAEREEAERAAEQAAARKRRLLQLGGLAVVAAIIVAVLVVVSSGGTDDAPERQAGETVAGQTEVRERFEGIPQDGIALGDPDAPVTLVEFVDMQCPFCADFARQGLPTILEEDVREGRVRLEIRTMAFIGDDSQTLARAVAGAAEQDRGWEALDLFFINQGRENSGFADEDYVRDTLSAIGGLDVDKALADGEGAAGTTAINEAQALASRLGIASTPSFAIGRTGESVAPIEVTDLGGGALRDRIRELAG
jgi:protein-disulfide isomerase